ncbi:hypothetical protein HYPSUDRAFT_46299, partial [Hypholoma sublateritium FD-334 SS-4]
MVFQAVGYRLNGDQMCRLAKCMTGIEKTNILHAYGLLWDIFDDIPDYCLRTIPAPGENPSGDPVNILFVIFSAPQVEPLSLERLRGRLRTARAKEWLRERGLAETDDMRLSRIYL